MKFLVRHANLCILSVREFRKNTKQMKHFAILCQNKVSLAIILWCYLEVECCPNHPLHQPTCRSFRGEVFSTLWKSPQVFPCLERLGLLTRTTHRLNLAKISYYGLKIQMMPFWFKTIHTHQNKHPSTHLPNSAALSIPLT